MCIRIGAAAAGKRLYSLPDIERTLHVPASASKDAAAKPRARVLYCRVSSAKQRADLDLRARYPEHEVIEDVASGINFHRRGLLALLDRAVRGGVEEVVVAHRDRLCRIAFELVEHVLAQCGWQGSWFATAAWRPQLPPPTPTPSPTSTEKISCPSSLTSSPAITAAALQRIAKRRARDAEEAGDEPEEEGEEGSEVDAGAEGRGKAPQGGGGGEEAL